VSGEDPVSAVFFGVEFLGSLTLWLCYKWLVIFPCRAFRGGAKEGPQYHQMTGKMRAHDSSDAVERTTPPKMESPTLLLGLNPGGGAFVALAEWRDLLGHILAMCVRLWGSPCFFSVFSSAVTRR
jgi:hypothetical protein